MKKLFIGIIIIAILGAGYYFYQKNTSPETTYSFNQIVKEKPKGLSEPQFTQLDEIKIVGFHRKTNLNNIKNDAPQVWMSLQGRYKEIKNIINPNAVIGIVTIDTTSLNSFDFFNNNIIINLDYMVGFQVNDTDSVPAGMTALTLPAHKYALFQHMGSSFEIQKSYAYIFQTWLPKSGMKLSQPITFQYYEKSLLGTGPTDPNAETSLYVPVE